MADKKISAATDTTPPLSTDMLPLARSGDTTARKLTLSNLLPFVASTLVTAWANVQTFAAGINVGAATGAGAGDVKGSGALTMTGALAGSNLSGSSSGTNTGDQTLPTLPSLISAATDTTPPLVTDALALYRDATARKITVGNFLAAWPSPAAFLSPITNFGVGASVQPQQKLNTLTNDAPFAITVGGSTFNGVYDDVLYIGFNAQSGNSKIVAGKASMALSFETNYFYLNKHRMELNFDLRPPSDAGAGYRYMSFGTDRDNLAQDANWSFWIGSAIGNSFNILERATGNALFQFGSSGDMYLARTIQFTSSTAGFQVTGNIPISFTVNGIKTVTVASAVQGLTFGDAQDVSLYRSAAGQLKILGGLALTGALGVGNYAPATTLGSVTRKIQVFGTDGTTSLGYIPVYGSIT